MSESRDNARQLEDRRCSWDEELLSRIRSSLLRQLAGWDSLPVPREDLVSESLLRLIGNDASEIESPFAYAGTILRNLIRDKIRALERARRLFDGVARERAPSLEPRPDRDTVGEGDLLAHLLGSTDLSPVQEKILNMMYFGGMTLTEVARELGKNPGTILRHHERAINKLSRNAAKLETLR
ncbi:MAG: sigma-70 family RNA polymerase sigma factor [Planctomycetota bacterium]